MSQSKTVPSTEQKEKKEKQYFLEKEETGNILSRQTLIREYQYLIHIINADIKGYVENVVLERLHIPLDKNYILSQDATNITLPGGEDPKGTHEPDTSAK